MIKKVFALLLVIGTLSLLVQPALASIYLRDPQVGDTVNFADPGSRFSDGGPFTATIHYQSDNTTQTWTTFCVELTEYLDFGNTFQMDTPPWTMSKTVNLGNVVSDEAKWLYHEFNAGNLHGQSAATFQGAIWALTSYSGGGALYTGADTGVAALVTLAATAASNNFYGFSPDAVRIMNPYREGNSGGPHAQSVLFEVPEPFSLVIWSIFGAGCAGLAVARRRMTTVSRCRPWSVESRQAILNVIERKR